MTYSESIEYLYSRLPVFHRVGAKAIKPGLGNIIRLCEALGNPQQTFKSIHVGGTNGKGSSSHMLAAVLQRAGYRTGLYTSPHLKSFTERIRVNGEPIAGEEVARFVARHRELIESVEPSFFEITVAMAFVEFARQRVDIAVIEVGLGGRLDSTNLITPLVSLITNIGWDHADILGDSLEAIASEKAGIIKPSVPVVISEKDESLVPIFQRVANQKGALLTFAEDRFTILSLQERGKGRRYRVEREGMFWGEVEVELLGGYQRKNLAGVLTILESLPPELPVSRTAIVEGLRDVVSLTGLKGRWQVLQQEPYVVCDTAHNEPGLKAVFSALGGLQYRRLHLVVGFVKDKDLSRVLALFPKDARYYFSQPESPRALAVAELVAFAAPWGLTGEAFGEVNTALQAALREAAPEDCILITGSTYLVAELTNL